MKVDSLPRNAIYREILRAYRTRLTPQDVGLEAGPGRGKLTQQNVDQILGGGAGVYQKVEAGRVRPSPEWLQRVGRKFRMTDYDLGVAVASLTGSEPVPRQRTPPHAWLAAVEGQSQPAFLIDHAGSVAMVNASARQIFGRSRAPENLWRWMLSEGGRSVLDNWADQWAPYVLAEIRRARARHPDDITLRDLDEEVARESSLKSLEPAQCGLDCRPRPLRHPARGCGEVQHLAAQIDGTAAHFVTWSFSPYSPTSI
ncbi:hypothetical protein ACH4TS_20445 [Streptomyces albidoflavus]